MLWRARKAVCPKIRNQVSVDSGYGVDSLLAPGHYPDPFTIGIPLTLKNSNPNAGSVLIGR